MSILNNWNQRNVNIRGRIAIEKSMIMSILMYGSAPLTMLHHTQCFIREFASKRRPPKVSAVTCQGIREGAFVEADVRHLYKNVFLSWIKLLKQAETGPRCYKQTVQRLSLTMFSKPWIPRMILRHCHWTDSALNGSSITAKSSPAPVSLRSNFAPVRQGCQNPPWSKPPKGTAKKAKKGERKPTKIMKTLNGHFSLRSKFRSQQVKYRERL